MQLAYVTPNDEMQIVDRHGREAEVYNFRSIYSDAHSHIHYPDYTNPYNKTVYRSLSNPTSETHNFYPKPYDAAIGAIPRSSIYDFDYEFEQLKSMNLNNLSKEQLEVLKDYILNNMSETRINGKTR